MVHCLLASSVAVDSYSILFFFLLDILRILLLGLVFFLKIVFIYLYLERGK